MRSTIHDHRSAAVPFVVGNIVLGVLGFLTSAAASQLLGSDGRGELAARQNIPNLLAVFGTLGLGEAALYFSARQPGAARKITDRALRLGFLGAIASMAISAVLIMFALSDQESRTGAMWYILVIPVTVLYTISYQPLRALGRTTLWMTFRVGIAFGWLICLIAGFVLDRASPQLMAMMFCGVMTVAALTAFAITRSYPDDQETTPTDRELFRYSLPTAFVSVPQAVNLRLDQVLLAGIVSRGELGVYVAAVGWSWVALPGFTAFAQFVMPKVAALDAFERDRWRRRVPGQVALLAAASFLLLIVPTRVLFAPVMGDDFRSGVNVATLMLLAGVLNGSLLVLEELAKGLGHPRWVLSAELGGLLMTGLLLFLLLEPFGIVGAAWASIVGYGAVSAILVVVLLKSDS